MNKNNFWAHFHLTVNELPVIGFLLAIVFLSLSLLTRNKDGWARAGMLTLCISVAGVLLAFFSGDPALDVISGQQRTSGRALTQHHVRSIYATVFAMITVILVIIAVVKAKRNNGVYKVSWIKIVLIASIVTFGALGWTGLAGGRINHPELQLPTDEEGGPAHPH